MIGAGYKAPTDAVLDEIKAKPRIPHTSGEVENSYLMARSLNPSLGWHWQIMNCESFGLKLETATRR